MNEMML